VDVVSLTLQRSQLGPWDRPAQRLGRLEHEWKTARPADHECWHLARSTRAGQPDCRAVPSNSSGSKESACSR
jgi:hypothetical protein